MTRRNSRVRRDRLTDTPRIHIPHSSWTNDGRRPEQDAPIRAETFWSRLGM